MRIAVLGFATVVCAQPTPDTLWTFTYHGALDAEDAAQSVQQTADGSYIVAGYTEVFNAGFDVLLVKLDGAGDTVWTRTYGGHSSDVARCIQQTTEGGFIVAGDTRSFGAGDADFYILRLNDDGDTLWTRTYGGLGREEGYSVQQTSDGGFIMAGYLWSVSGNNQDIYLVKTDGDGDTVWTQTYGGSGEDWATSVEQTSDGGFVVACSFYRQDAERNDFCLLKTNEHGDTLWTRRYANSGDWPYSVHQTLDGGYIMAGSVGSLGAGEGDMFVVRTNASGDTLWTKTFGGDRQDGAYSVQEVQDGGFIVAGWTWSYGHRDDDIYLVRLNGSGDTLWTRAIGGPYAQVAISLQRTTDGGYIIAGFSTTLDPSYGDFYVVKTGADEMRTEPIDGQVSRNYILYPSYPNPFNATTTLRFDLPRAGMVTLRIYDVLGREAATLVRGVKAAGHHSVIWNATAFPSGLYFARLEADGFMQTHKLLALK
ncbi:MAG: T9SS type A sorting domain-containing protein [bacterium]